MSENSKYENYNQNKRGEGYGATKPNLNFQYMEGNGGNISDRSPEFCRIMEEWLQQIAATRKYSTFIKYEKLYNCHIKNLFEGDCITQITSSYIKEKLISSDMSDTTKQSILTLINQTLQYAEEYYGFPAISVKNRFVRKKRKPVVILNRTEQVRLMRFLHHNINPRLFTTQS